MSDMNNTPTEPKRRSPWLWVGLGCGVSVLLAFGGCVAFLGLVGTQVSQEMAKPINSAEAAAQLGDVPIYEPSTLNETLTKGLRIGSSMMPKNMMTAVAFDITDDPAQVMAWYEQKMLSQGYQKAAGQPSPKPQITQRAFQKQDNTVLVQIQEDATDKQGYTLMLMRLKGLQPDN